MLPLLVAVATLIPSGHVNDFAHILQPATVSTLETTLREFETNTGNEIAVVTIDAHGTDETIETYAEKLFQKWGIGKAKEDNGLLLLISKDDREMRFEVGYGLEPIITDIESAHIISDVLRPAFQSGDYDAGVTAAINRITDDIGRGGAPPKEIPIHSFNPNILTPLVFVLVFLSSVLARSKSWWLGGVIGGIVGAVLFHTLIYILIFAGFGLLADFIVSRKYHQSKNNGIDPPWWIGGPGSGMGGGRGGGFGGFGGGMSGGGGASGRW